MDWNLAIEKNHEALKRILAVLVAMVRMLGDEPKTLPRHLHRYVLRLLRPAEAATRRLIIVAARGLVVKLSKPRAPKPKPEQDTIFVLDRVGGRMVSVPVPVPKPVRPPARPRSLLLSLLDPMKRFGVRRKYVKPAAMPSIRLLGSDDNPLAQFFRRPEPVPPSAPPPPSPDDLLDAGRLMRRLDALASALGDLPGQAQRMARWQARRDARLAREREGRIVADGDFATVDPHSVSPFGLATSPPIDGGEEARRQGPAPFLYPREAGGEVARAKPETEWGDIHLPRHSQQVGSAAFKPRAAAPPKRKRFHRISPMRPGRPPGWRRKPNHDVYEVLNELHGLAVWARDGP